MFNWVFPTSSLQYSPWRSFVTFGATIATISMLEAVGTPSILGVICHRVCRILGVDYHFTLIEVQFIVSVGIAVGFFTKPTLGDIASGDHDAPLDEEGESFFQTAEEEENDTKAAVEEEDVEVVEPAPTPKKRRTPKSRK